MARINSLEILNATGIKTPRTLTRWHNQGLIPKPTMDSHPNGQGRIAYWPSWVIERCRRIRDLTEQGLRLEEIKEKIGADWKKDEAHYLERYRLRDANERLDHAAAVRNFADLTSNQILPFLAPLASDRRKVIRLLDDFLFNEETVTTVLEAMHNGLHPILIYDGESLEIVPDFIAAQLLSDSASSGQTFVMKSIYQEARLAFGKLIESPPPHPVVKPAEAVEMVVNGESKRTEFNRVGRVDYEFCTKKEKKPGKPRQEK